MSLMTLGTVAIDTITTPSGLEEGLLGGSASHFSMSAGLFTDVSLVSVIGEDFPEKYTSFLKDKGINLSSVMVEDGKTFSWAGEYKAGDLNSAITHETELGVLANYSPQITPDQKNISNIFLANFDPDVQLEFLKLLDNPKFIGMDTMNLWIDIKRSSVESLMKKVNLFIVNDGEATALSGESNLIKAAKKLKSMGPDVVIVKKGEHGVLVYSDDYMFSFPAYPVEKVVDPTGAGDTFAGGVMGHLSGCDVIDEKSMRRAVIFGTALASFNVEGFSMSKTAPLTMDVVNTRVEELLKFITP